MNPGPIFFTSFLVALTGAMMPGPVLAVTVRESAGKGFKAGPLMILGHGILELVLIAALLAGFSSAFRDPYFLVGISLAGGTTLIWMGITGWRKSGRDLKFAADNRTPPTGDLHTVLAGILSSVSNPYWFIWWATIGMAYLGSCWKFGWIGLISFYSGHILADLAWYSLVSGAVGRGKKLFSPLFHRRLLQVCSLAMIALGVYFIGNGLW